MAQVERQGLCDDSLLVGQDAPTLSGDWTVKDLVVHLLIREGHPAAAGIVVPQLSRVLDLASRRLARTEFTVLVERLRQGPPIYSPMALPRVDALANTIEFFVHHEDIRRAQPGWEPRELSPGKENLLWKMASTAGRGSVRSSTVGVTLQRSDTDADPVVLKKADPQVIVTGLPSELVLFVMGRTAQARVELHGPEPAVQALKDSSLGI